MAVGLAVRGWYANRIRGRVDRRRRSRNCHVAHRRLGVPPVVLSRVDSGLYVIAPCVAAGSAAWAARSSSGRQRLAWLCMLFGLIGWTVGAASVVRFEALLSGRTLSTTQTWPFVLFPIGFGAALLLFPTGLTRRYLGRFLLDATIVAGSFFLVFWLVVMDEVYKAAGPGQGLTQLLPAVYAAMEIAVMTFALLLVVRGPSDQRATLALLTAGLARRDLVGRRLHLHLGEPCLFPRVPGRHRLDRRDALDRDCRALVTPAEGARPRGANGVRVGVGVAPRTDRGSGRGGGGDRADGGFDLAAGSGAWGVPGSGSLRPPVSGDH